jgi:CubicO group peptidase (beta-lactamase class C family)
LQQAEAYAATIDTAAAMLVHDGLVVWELGKSDRVYRAHSIRKSFLSALYGIYVAEGTLQLDKTMADFGIDDNEPSLTKSEKTATVRDLLKSRSGIYHAALYESPDATANKPPRESHAAGTHWHYNNWDFNALGTIFDRAVGSSLYMEFENRIAIPIGMQDFIRRKHTEYITGDQSVHPAYTFEVSTRDLARFGLLFARNGRWDEEQIIPETWIAESTTSYSDAQGSGGYGYMWWVAANGRHVPNVAIPDGAYSAQGANGHYLLVLPEWDVVVVHRVNTYIGRQVTPEQFGKFLYLLLEARPGNLAPEFDLSPADEGLRQGE